MEDNFDHQSILNELESLDLITAEEAATIKLPSFANVIMAFGKAAQEVGQKLAETIEAFNRQIGEDLPKVSAELVGTSKKITDLGKIQNALLTDMGRLSSEEEFDRALLCMNWIHFNRGDSTEIYNSDTHELSEPFYYHDIFKHLPGIPQGPF